MDKTKSPVSKAERTEHVVQKDNEQSVSFVNFNDNTVLNIFQVLSLLAEQNGTPKVKLTLRKEA